MPLKYPKYTDDEVKIFHPFFAECAQIAIKNKGLEDELQVVHHRSFNGITVDFSIERIKSKRIVLLVEVKRTKSAVESTRYRHQALSYRKEADHLCETPYYILTNIEHTDVFRYDANKPRVSSQLIKGSPFSCGDFNSCAVDEFIKSFSNRLGDIIDVALNDSGEYDQNLDFLYDFLQDKVDSYETWHSSLMPFSYEYIRGSAVNYNELSNKIKSLNWKAADSYISAPLRLSEKGSQVDFSHIFKGPLPAAHDKSAFQKILLESAYYNGKSRGKGDDVSEIVYDLLAPRGPGIVETDQELANLLSVLSKIELGRSLEAHEIVCDPAAGSGRLLTAATNNAYTEIPANRIWANEIEQHFAEALSLRLGLHFGDTISVENCPSITISDVACLTPEDFRNVKVVLVNPPYVSGIYSKNKRLQIDKAIKCLSGESSKTNSGQIGLEGPFVELLINLMPDDAIIAAILPYSLLTRKSKEIQLYRKFLLEDFGLSMVCCYPREGLFENVIKRTCIFVGRKKAHKKIIRWIDINSPIERLDLHEMQNSFDQEQRLFQVSDINFEDLKKSIDSGWVNNIKKEAKEWFEEKLLKHSVLISDEFPQIKRGTSGNSGSSDLSAMPIKKHNRLIQIVPIENQLPAINNSEGLEKYLTKDNAPCVSPIIAQDGDSDFLSDLINEYISIKQAQKSTGKQTKAPINYDKVKQSLLRDITEFPIWSILIPRSVRVSGNISILKASYNISTNFIVVNCESEQNAIITASWLFSIFGQLQMEFLCNDQEGARKLEKNEISKLLIPNKLNKNVEIFFHQLQEAFEKSDPINYKKVELREIDKLWASILSDQPSDLLQTALNYLQDIVDERAP